MRRVTGKVDCLMLEKFHRGELHIDIKDNVAGKVSYKMKDPECFVELKVRKYDKTLKLRCARHIGTEHECFIALTYK